MKILIVEDEHKIANSIKKGLSQEGYVVDVAYDGVEGFDLATTGDYDIVVLDLMLPGMNGMEICRQLRLAKNHTPILMLTARGEIQDRVEGLNTGADDYLVKPFAFEELLARIKAVGRRPIVETSSILKVDDLILDTNNFELKRGKSLVVLSKKEFALLEYLMRNVDKTLSKDKIISHVWDYDAEILPNTVEVFIGYLRQKIDKAFPNKKNLIKTVRGFGYKVSAK